MRPTLTDRIRQAQDKDEILKKTRAKVESGKETYFHIDPEGALRFGNRICVPNE